MNQPPAPFTQAGCRAEMVAQAKELRRAIVERRLAEQRMRVRMAALDATGVGYNYERDYRFRQANDDLQTWRHAQLTAAATIAALDILARENLDLRD